MSHISPYTPLCPYRSFKCCSPKSHFASALQQYATPKATSHQLYNSTQHQKPLCISSATVCNMTHTLDSALAQTGNHLLQRAISHQTTSCLQICAACPPVSTILKSSTGSVPMHPFPSCYPQCKVLPPQASKVPSDRKQLHQILLPGTAWHATVLQSLTPSMREFQVRLPLPLQFLDAYVRSTLISFYKE
jgi:hypothetical protein